MKLCKYINLIYSMSMVKDKEAIIIKIKEKKSFSPQGTTD